MNLSGKLSGLTDYATYIGVPPTISMKVYTTAPVGTPIEIQLGKSGKISYPEGTHSQYQAKTTVRNAWEVVKFKFSEIPKGSKTSVEDVDQITILFNPNTLTSDKYYFDEITGPVLVAEKAETAPIAAPNKVQNTKTLVK